MSTTFSPPASPTKGGLLRKLVTGVQPTSPEEHARRWNRSTAPAAAAPSNPPPASNGQQGSSRHGRVASMVQGFEAVSLSASSRPYSSIPLPPSPVKSSFPPPQNASQPLPLPSPTSPTRQTPSPTTSSGSPVVPASFFQQQQAKRTPPTSPVSKIGQQPSQAAGKENRSASAEAAGNARLAQSTRPSAPSRSSAYPFPASQPRQASISSTSSTGGHDGGTASSEVSVETMATRSSNSTHASSLVSSSAEGAYIGRATKVEVGPRPMNYAQSRFLPTNTTNTSNETPRKTIPTATRAPHPMIIETAPTPQRRSDREGAPSPPLPLPSPANQVSQNPPPRPRPQHQRQPSIPQPAPVAPQRTASTFTEALPSSFSHAQTNSPAFAPLPLENPPPTPIAKDGFRRARASSMGGGLKVPAIGGSRPTETMEEKEKRVDEAFGRLLVRFFVSRRLSTTKRS